MATNSETPTHTTVHLAPSVHCAILEDSAVILDAEKGLYFSVNETGAVILSALQKKQSVAEMLQQLVNAFDCTDKQAQADIHGFLRALNAAGLLHTGES